ncbi:hypothetical protein HDV63DRAFT_226128 [Trichoderma sp. SZMC 28014]
MSVTHIKQLLHVQINNTQAQIASLAMHQGQQLDQQMDIFSSIKPVVAAADAMGSIYYLIYMFHFIETNVFLMLGLSPATAFRMFPPLEQFPPGSVAPFVIFMQFASLSALFLCIVTALFAEIRPVQDLDHNAGLLTALFRLAAGNNSALNSLLRFIRMWLFMASMHSLSFQFYDEPDLLLLMAKGRALMDLL